MADVFVTLVAISPSVAVQPETDAENDAVMNPQSQGTMKQGLYAKRRKQGATRPTK